MHTSSNRRAVLLRLSLAVALAAVAFSFGIWSHKILSFASQAVVRDDEHYPVVFDSVPTADASEAELRAHLRHYAHEIKSEEYFLAALRSQSAAGETMMASGGLGEAAARLLRERFENEALARRQIYFSHSLVTRLALRRAAAATESERRARELATEGIDPRDAAGTLIEPEELTTFTVVEVGFATNRSMATQGEGKLEFGPGRSNLRFGKCSVSIPPGHRTGFIERPKFYRLELVETPVSHMVVLRTTLLTEDAFLNWLDMGLRKSGTSNGLVFIHGYNVLFSEAALRTAQLAEDLGYDGPALFFSWPSDANISAYLRDREDIAWSRPFLVYLLRRIAISFPDSRFDIVAHSMGNLGLVEALASLGRDEPQLRSVFREIVLAAPDIDSDVFRSQFLDRLKHSHSRLTLYASSRDRPLMASRSLQGYPRLGDSSQNILVAPDLDTIDATAASDDILGHSGALSARSALWDMSELLRHHRPPATRPTLRRRESPGGTYWSLRE